MTMDHSRVRGHVLLVEHGRIGARVVDALTVRGRPIVVAEHNRDIVESLRARGMPAVSGDAVESAVLIQAHVARVAVPVVTAGDPMAARSMTETARVLSPDIACVAGAPGAGDAARLASDTTIHMLYAEESLAEAMTQSALPALAAK
jgi:CPA2 family monovalent cation:H+ antiporter-2